MIKKYFLSIFIYLSFILVLGGCGCRGGTSNNERYTVQSNYHPSKYYFERKWEEKPTRYNEIEVNKFISKMDNKFKTLGFKGLHLGMTHAQVNELVKKTPWGYKVSPYSTFCPDDPQYKSWGVLARDDSVGTSASWATIGTEGGDSYGFYSAHVRYFDDKVISIVLSSRAWPADTIKTITKDWGRFALKGLIKKYGNPTIVYGSIEDINIFSFESGYEVTLYEWDKGKEMISLSIGESEATFNCSICFSDVEGLNNQKKEKSKNDKTEF